MNTRYSRLVFASIVLVVIGAFVAQSTLAQGPPQAPAMSKSPAMSKAPVGPGSKDLSWPRLMGVSELDVLKTQLYVVLRSDSFLAHSGDSSFNPFSSESPSVGPDQLVYAGIFMHINNNSADASRLISSLRSLNYYIAFNQGPIGSVPAIYKVTAADFNLTPAPATLPWQSSIFSGGVRSIRQAGMGDAVNVYYTGSPAPFGYISHPDDSTPGANFAINTSYMLCEVTLRTQSASSLRFWQSLLPPFTPPYPGQVAPFAGPQVTLPPSGSPFPFFGFQGAGPFLRDYTPDRLADYADTTPPPLRVFKPEPLQNLFVQVFVPGGTRVELAWASHPVLSGLVDEVIPTSSDMEWHFPSWTAYREEPSQEFSITTAVRLRVASGDVRFIFPVDSNDVRYLISIFTQADLPPAFDFNQNGQMYAFIPVGEGFKTMPTVQNGYMAACSSSKLDKSFLLREHLSIDGTETTMEIGIGSDVPGDCEVWLFSDSQIGNFENPTQGKVATWKFTVTSKTNTRFVSAKLNLLGVDNIGSMVIRPVNKPNANITIDYIRFSHE